VGSNIGGGGDRGVLLIEEMIENEKATIVDKKQQKTVQKSVQKLDKFSSKFKGYESGVKVAGGT